MVRLFTLQWSARAYAPQQILSPGGLHCASKRRGDVTVCRGWRVKSYTYSKPNERLDVVMRTCRMLTGKRFAVEGGAKVERTNLWKSCNSNIHEHDMGMNALNQSVNKRAFPHSHLVDHLRTERTCVTCYQEAAGVRVCAHRKVLQINVNSSIFAHISLCAHQCKSSSNRTRRSCRKHDTFITHFKSCFKS